MATLSEQPLSFRELPENSAIAAIVEIINTSQRADAPELTDLTIDGHREMRDRMRQNMRGLHNIFAVDSSGKPIAYVELAETLNPYLTEFYCYLCVRPEWRSRGVATRLLLETETLSRTVKANHATDKPIELIAYFPSEDISEAISALLSRAGFGSGQHGVTMLRDLNTSLPTFAQPAGIVIQPADVSQRRAIMSAFRLAFNETATDAQTDSQLDGAWNDLVEQSAGDISRWRVALADGGIVGGVFASGRRAWDAPDATHGWTDPIWVISNWRRRGVAKALISETLHLLKADGFSHAKLGVYVNNLSNALGLYEQLGYVKDSHSIEFRKRL